MDIRRIASFSLGDTGGNPAGIVLLDTPIPDTEMARIAARTGYSETAFAIALDGSKKAWRVRYFSPESEVPFCGHATIALGVVLGRLFGAGAFDLDLNEARIKVEAHLSDGAMAATLSSPPTRSRATTADELAQTLDLFGLARADLDDRLPPAYIHAGADHILLALKDRARLAAMTYDLGAGRDMMRRHGLATIMLVHIEGDQCFVARNAFASGGVLEDPATGAAAAALAGYLRDLNWPHGGAFTVRQGEDMGQPSLIEVELDDTPKGPVRISGRARDIPGHGSPVTA